MPPAGHIRLCLTQHERLFEIFYIVCFFACSIRGVAAGVLGRLGGAAVIAAADARGASDFTQGKSVFIRTLAVAGLRPACQ